MPERKTLANAIRVLAMDAVQAANSGHPGMPMGMADIAEVLWNDFLKHNPANPNWFDRDRVVLSNGHGSMLIYAVLHLTGYDLPMEELRNFRQLHSRTAGHPEADETPGVETTTGPLGQGLANAVGMAMAEQVLAKRFNRPDHEIIDHHTYVLLGDGCLMEGVSHEACSLAGTHGLGKLIALYDDNGISIDGEVEGWFTENTRQRFEAYGWHVIDAVDGHDPEALRAAIASAQEENTKPSIICCRTVIGCGAPNKQGTEATHGAPLGEEEIAAARAHLGWDAKPFEIPEDVYAGWNAINRGAEFEAAWSDRFEAYAQAYPELAKELQRRLNGGLPEDFDQLAWEAVEKMDREAKDMASRKASQMALDAYGPHLPELIGGSADLAGSNNTIWKGSRDIQEAEDGGNYVYFGVREFGMTAIANGLDLHGGFIPYVATFLVFSDYARNAVRMSALIPCGTIHVYTHDSIGLGEDGPTHQPVEHLASLRHIPNLDVWRPCDAVESMVAWKAALQQREQPSALIFTRQGIPHQHRTSEQLRQIEQGAYVLLEPDNGSFDAIIIATGSEVGLAMDAARELNGQGKRIRVVSMPCVERFEAQPIEYRQSVLPDHCRARVAIEAGIADYWHKYVGLDGKIIGMHSFGASAPAKDLFPEFGFTKDNVMQAVESLLD